MFRPRQSTNDHDAPLESRPTSGQPTIDKSSSKLVRRLKRFQSALRTSRLNNKDRDRPNETPKSTHKPNPRDESLRNLAPGALTPEDYNFRRASPIPSYHDLGSDFASITKTSHNGAPTTTRAAHPESNWPINPFPVPAALAVTTLANSSSRFYELFLSPEEEAELLADAARIAGLNVHRAEAQALRSRQLQATNIIPHASSTTQRSNTAVAAHQSAEELRLPATKSSTKTEKRRVEGRNKWWEKGGKLRNTKRHVRREAVDFGNPNALYYSVEQIAHRGHALKRGRANRRRGRPQNHHSPKDRQESTASVGDQPISSRDTAEKAPAPIETNLFKFHKYQSKFIEMFEESHQPVGKLNDEGNSTRDSAARRPVSATRHPLGPPDLNIVPSGGAQESHQADGAEDSVDADHNAHHVPSPHPSL